MAVTNQTLVDTSFKTIIKTVCDNAANTDGDRNTAVGAFALDATQQQIKILVLGIKH